MRRLPLLLPALLLLASNLGAASDILIPRSSPGAGELAVGPSSGIGASTLVVAVVCAAAGAWLFWRGRRQSAGRQGRGKLSVAESRSLGNRQYLVVAAYGKQRFLIGVCVGRMSLLAPLDDGDNPAPE